MQIFHHSTNTISRVSIYGAVFIAALLGGVLYAIELSPIYTRVNEAREQPVPFSHKHHAGELGIDCRYCHTSVEKSSSAGVPPTQTCMTCHSQIWTNASMLEPVRASYRDDKSIEWIRVNALPDFVYFDHSIHVAKGRSIQSVLRPAFRSKTDRAWEKAHGGIPRAEFADVFDVPQVMKARR